MGAVDRMRAMQAFRDVLSNPRVVKVVVDVNKVSMFYKTPSQLKLME